MNHLNKVLLLSLISLSLNSSDVFAGWLDRVRSNSKPAAIGVTAFAVAGLARWGLKKFYNWRKKPAQPVIVTPTVDEKNTGKDSDRTGDHQTQDAPKKTWCDTTRNIGSYTKAVGSTIGSYALVPVKLACKHRYITYAVSVPTVAAVLAYTFPSARKVIGKTAGKIVPQKFAVRHGLITGSAVAALVAMYSGAKGIQKLNAYYAAKERNTQKCVFKLVELFIYEINLAYDPKNTDLLTKKTQIDQWFADNGRQGVLDQLALNGNNPAPVILDLLRPYNKRNWANSVSKSINAEITITGNQTYTLPDMFEAYKTKVAVILKEGMSDEDNHSMGEWIGAIEARISEIVNVVKDSIVPAAPTKLCSDSDSSNR